MNRSLFRNVMLVVLVLGLSGIAGCSKQDRNTALGAGVGAAAGYAVTGGRGEGAAIGAVAGGLLGRSVSD